jgi:hypothetical protein
MHHVRRETLGKKRYLRLARSLSKKVDEKVVRSEMQHAIEEAKEVTMSPLSLVPFKQDGMLSKRRWR